MGRWSHEGEKAEHQAIRRATIAGAYGKPCARCRKPMLPGQRLALDHADDRAGYLGYSHKRCNEEAGGRKGNAAKRKATNMLKVCALAVEVSWNRSHTSIGAAGDLDDGRRMIELVDYLPGTGSVVDAVRALGRSRSVVVVVIDPRSPASNLRREFVNADVPVYTSIATGDPAQKVTAHTWTGDFGVLEPDHTDVATAQGDLLDELQNGRLAHDGSDLLTKAMRYATSRPLAGQTAWERRPDAPDVDPSPAQAVTLALWAWLNRPVELSPFFL